MSTPSEATEVNAPASGDDSGLVLKDVYRVFPGNVMAVENANLHVENGEYVTLLGPSGCGKTTTLRMIGGHDEPSSGTISLDGQVLNGVEPAKRPVTTVSSTSRSSRTARCSRTSPSASRCAAIGKAEREKTAGDAVEMVGLGSMKQRKPRELSSGQQQRVALARVLVTRPKAILLDEPFGDLDRLLQLRMRVELRALQRDLGITFIHVTHNQEEALSMSDRIVVMNDGRIQQTGTPTELARFPKNVFVARFMGDNNTVRGPIESADGDTITIRGEHLAGARDGQGHGRRRGRGHDPRERDRRRPQAPPAESAPNVRSGAAQLRGVPRRLGQAPPRDRRRAVHRQGGGDPLRRDARAREHRRHGALERRGRTRP